jgi:(1->4)-alpha-D-glucan 1-alpha-D-glucosylmutase
MDAAIVARAIRVARRQNPEVSPSVFAFLRDQLLFEGPKRSEREAGPETQRFASDQTEFAMRFQQLTGPVVAKGIEDTAFYRYLRFVALNEVGASLERFGTSITSFHGMNADRLGSWPRSMTTTGTHDTKRGEDVRARLAVLSEMPEAFAAWIREWRELTARFATSLDEADGNRASQTDLSDAEDARAPSAGDQYLFFQTVLGAYPLASRSDDVFVGRIVEYMIKAAREAKQHTSWLSSDESYEGALRRFVEGALGDAAFLESLDAKANAIATHGASNGLAQVLLKVASPGVPDTYQGSETWDLRLVDPDNRAPVDYGALREALAALEGASVRDLLDEFRDGRLKLHVLSRALRLRRKLPAVFLEGDYRPIEAGDEIVAFARTHATGAVICAVTRQPYRATGGRAPWACGDVWGAPDDPKRRLLGLPEGRWRDVLADRVLVSDGGGTAAADVFQELPVALLVMESH